MRSSSGRVRTIILLLTVLIPMLSACSSWTEKSDQQNVILLVIDTLRADHLGCYGYGRNTSPFLDELSEKAYLFTDVTSQAPWTNPSVVSILTSLYPSTHHLLTLRSGGKMKTLSRNITTLAELLKAEGYSTAAFSANPWLVPGIGIERGFDVFKDLPIKTKANSLHEIALEWVRRNNTTGQPFFLYIHYMDVHGPYTPPSPYDTLFTSRIKTGRELSSREIEIMPGYLRINGLGTLDEYIGRYDGGIRYWDECFSVFLENLSLEGYLKNTILIVTSDHGEEFLEHDGFNHGSTLFQEQVHVPLLLRSPDAGGGVIEEPVELVDIVPSLLSMLGISIPQFLQGNNLVPLLHGENHILSPVFSEGTVAFGGVPLPGGSFKSVRVGEFKLILNTETGTTKLYDLSADPGELKKNFDDKSPERARALAVLRGWMERSSKAGERYESGVYDIGKELDKNLKALGYVDP